MNCFLLFLLLRCCGWGDGCGCNSGRGGCGCRMEQRGCCCGSGREMPGRGCCEGMDSGRNDSCRRDMGRQPECCECREERRGHDGCGCEEERHDHDHGDCGCMERENTCDGPGMVPPPWQEYPKFPRRDKCDECGE